MGLGFNQPASSWDESWSWHPLSCLGSACRVMSLGNIMYMYALQGHLINRKDVNKTGMHPSWCSNFCLSLFLPTCEIFLLFFFNSRSMWFSALCLWGFTPTATQTQLRCMQIIAENDGSLLTSFDITSTEYLTEANHVELWLLKINIFTANRLIWEGRVKSLETMYLRSFHPEA